MRYAASLNAGLGGLMHSIWAQPQGNGTLDAMKVAEGESTIAKNNAGIGKDNAEADKITKRLRDMYDPQLNQDVSAGMLPNATPEQRASATINMLRLTDNPQHLTDSFGEGLSQANYQRALDDPNFAPNFNRANASKDGKMYSNVGDSGLVLSQANGLQGVGNQPQYDAQLAKTKSETVKNNATTGKTISDLNKPDYSIEKDGSGAMFYVDKNGKSAPKPILNTDGTPFKGATNNVVFKNDVNGNLYALNKDANNPNPTPVIGAEGKQFVGQSGALIQMRANSLDVAGNEAVNQLDLIAQMPAGQGLSAFQDAQSKGGTYLQAFKNVTSRQLTNEDAVAYQAAMSGLGMEVARLANSGYAPTDGQIKAITEGATVKEGQDTVFTSTLKFLKLAQNARAALEAAKIGTPEQRKQRDEIVKKLEKYPKPVQFYNAYKRSDKSTGAVIDGFKSSQQPAPSSNPDRQDYVSARNQAYKSGNYDLVRKMDAEAKKDGLIK